MVKISPTIVTWPREFTDHQQILGAIKDALRAGQNYYVPLEVLIIWLRLVWIELNSYRF